MLTIVPYQSKYAKNFKELNLAWITEYFKVEEKDRELLDNCESSIIKKDGYIFIALWDNKPIGCFALLKISEFNFELGKMAVSKSHQGLKIGQELLVYAINFARNENWQKLILYSGTKLGTALHIYKKLGFTPVPLENNSIYLRSDIKMELTL